MNYKAIICDLDGTLLNEAHTISEETRETIKEVVDKGIIFIIATGRHYADASAFKKMLGLDTYLITSNGAKVHDYNENEIISHNISKEQAEVLLNYKYNEKLHKNIYVNNVWYTERELLEAKEFHKESGFFYNLASFDSLVGTEATKFFFICEEEEYISELEKDLKEIHGDSLNITLSLPSCLEIMRKGTSKASAIEEVLGRLGITLEETIAFGDGLNDLEMLSIVNKGFIMENGSNRLKEELPNNEIIQSNNNNGVAKKLRELFL